MMVKEKRKMWQTEKGSTSQPARDVKSTSEATRTTTVTLYIDKSKNWPDKRSYGTSALPPPSLTIEEYPERKGCSTTTDEFTSREKPRYEARSFPKAMTTSRPATQELRRRRSLYSANSGGPKSRKMSKPTSKAAKLVNEQSLAHRPRPPRYTRTRSQKDHGHWPSWLSRTRCDPHDRWPILQGDRTRCL